jgi:peroxiredoxin
MRKVTNTAKVLNYLSKRPNEKPSVIAKATGVSIQSVYQIKHIHKKERITGKLIKSSPKKEKLIMTYDNVNHPSHYKVGGIETIDFIEAKQLDYHLGNVVKYISRAEHKDEKLENLKKAQWYLNRAVSNLSK